MNFLRLTPILLGLLLSALNALAQDIKCATVDVNKLITEYHVANKELSVLKAAKEKYDQERKQRRKTLDEVETKIKALITKLRSDAVPQAQRSMLTEKYEDLTSQHNSLSKDLREADLEQVREIKTKISAATRRLLDEIHVIIGKYAKDNKYHWIIDSSGVSNTKISPLIYARDTKDVTEEILAILNKDAPKEKADSE